METVSYIRFVLVLLMIIGVILLLGAAARKFILPALTGARLRPGGKPRRLRVEESLTIDPRRRLVLVSRDGVEHLLLLGAHNDVVVERTAVAPPAPLGEDAGPGPDGPDDGADGDDPGQLPR